MPPRTRPITLLLERAAVLEKHAQPAQWSFGRNTVSTHADTPRRVSRMFSRGPSRRHRGKRTGVRICPAGSEQSSEGGCGLGTPTYFTTFIHTFPRAGRRRMGRAQYFPFYTENVLGSPDVVRSIDATRSTIRWSALSASWICTLRLVDLADVEMGLPRSLQPANWLPPAETGTAHRSTRRALIGSTGGGQVHWHRWRRADQRWARSRDDFVSSPPLLEEVAPSE